MPTQPYVGYAQVLNAAAANQTLTWGPGVPTSNPGGLSLVKAGVIKLQLLLSDFTGTIDLQASPDGTNWINVPYYKSSVAPLGSVSVSQIVYGTATTAQEHYTIPHGPYIYFRIVMTRTAGTISAWVIATTEE